MLNTWIRNLPFVYLTTSPLFIPMAPFFRVFDSDLFPFLHFTFKCLLSEYILPFHVIGLIFFDLSHKVEPKALYFPVTEALIGDFFPHQRLLFLFEIYQRIGIIERDFYPSFQSLTLEYLIETSKNFFSLIQFLKFPSFFFLTTFCWINTSLYLYLIKNSTNDIHKWSHIYPLFPTSLIVPVLHLILNFGHIE